MRFRKLVVRILELKYYIRAYKNNQPGLYNPESKNYINSAYKALFVLLTNSLGISDYAFS